MIDKADVIAAVISGTGGLFTWSNVFRLYYDKHIRGVNWWTNIYFMLAGCYSAFFLLHLHAQYAFMGTLVTVSANAAWVCLALRYRKNL